VFLRKQEPRATGVARVALGSCVAGARRARKRKGHRWLTTDAPDLTRGRLRRPGAEPPSHRRGPWTARPLAQ